MIVGGGEQSETLHAPAVAEIRMRIYTRPHYLHDQPIAVDRELWIEAERELSQILEARGWPLLADGNCKQMNFMLCGIAVVVNE